MKKGEIRKEGFQSININHWNNSSCPPLHFYWMPIVAANILRTVSSLTAPLYRVSRLCYHFSTLPNPVTDFVRVRIHDFNHPLLFLDGVSSSLSLHICNWEEEEETRILFGHRCLTSSFNCWQVSVDGFNINNLIYSFSLDSFLHGLEWNFTGGFFFILRF